MKVDIHMHSTVSDGSCTPCELVHRCLKAGVTHAALTDHESADGVKEFLDEAQKCGLKAISGLEYTVAYEGEMHILAYDFDPDYAPLNNVLSEMAERRRTRANRMVERLNECGIPVALERVKEIAGDGILGRPHIAKALFELGYGSSVEDSYKRYLEPDMPGWIPRVKIDSRRAIQLAKEAGGVTVLAHPRLTHYPDFDELLTRLKDEGLDGLEVYYPQHSDEDVVYFNALARKYDLFITQGSDYHGDLRRHTSIAGEQRGGDDLNRSITRLFSRHKA